MDKETTREVEVINVSDDDKPTIVYDKYDSKIKKEKEKETTTA